MQAHPVKQFGIKQIIYRLQFGQLILIGVLSLVFLFWQGQVAAVSSLLGGLIGWLPNVYFTWRAFSTSGAGEATKVLGRFYIGELEKFLISIGLLIAVFVLIKSLDIVGFFSGYIVVLITLPYLYILMIGQLKKKD